MELPKSKYKGIVAQRVNTRIYWLASKQHKGKKYQKHFMSEREAALGHDKMCLSFGLEPVNILVKKPLKSNK